jgi:Domain of unknown function (DUF1851)
MDLLDTVSTAWGFTGLVPKRILDVNPFGNLLVEDLAGQVWRICPEEASCEIVPSSARELEDLTSSPDWTMESLTELAVSLFGEQGPGRCFCLKLPGVLGGAYERDNLGAITVAELIAFSGDLASQIKDVPDGAQVVLKVVE